MAVMAAAMEAARNGRAPAQVGVFLHRQRIHVGTQADAFSIGALAPEHADHARAANSAMYLDAPLLHLVGNDPGGADFLKPDLRMRVQIAADRGEFVGI